jgi:hypothetical protein
MEFGREPEDGDFGRQSLIGGLSSEVTTKTKHVAWAASSLLHK